MRVHHGVETFLITLVRHLAQPTLKAAIDRSLPSDVLGPVDRPPWNLHLPPRNNSLHWQGRPFLFFAPQIFRSFFLPYRIPILNKTPISQSRLLSFHHKKKLNINHNISHKKAPTKGLGLFCVFSNRNTHQNLLSLAGS